MTVQNIDPKPDTPRDIINDHNLDHELSSIASWENDKKEITYDLDEIFTEIRAQNLKTEKAEWIDSNNKTHQNSEGNIMILENLAYDRSQKKLDHAHASWIQEAYESTNSKSSSNENKFSKRTKHKRSSERPNLQIKALAPANSR